VRVARGQQHRQRRMILFQPLGELISILAAGHVDVGKHDIDMRATLEHAHRLGRIDGLYHAIPGVPQIFRRSPTRVKVIFDQQHCTFGGVVLLFSGGHFRIHHPDQSSLAFSAERRRSSNRCIRSMSCCG
jgi:hypothetical protein